MQINEQNNETEYTNAPAVEQPEAGAPEPPASGPSVPNADEQQHRRRNALIALGVLITAAVIAVIIIVIINVTGPPSVKLSNYLEISVTGYNGYGNASYSFNIEKFDEEYGDRVRFYDENTHDNESAADYITDRIDGSISSSRNLSNGDRITFTWDASLKSIIEDQVRVSLNTKDLTYTVEGLPEVENVDYFQYVTLAFSGISTKGTAEMTLEDCDWLSDYDFVIDKTENLSNGDRVTISIDELSLEILPGALGKSPEKTKKEYTVSGLTDPMSINDMSDDTKSALTSESETLLRGETEENEEWRNGRTLDSARFIGNYFLSDNEEIKNDRVYFIYKVQVTQEYDDESSDFTYYWYAYASCTADYDDRTFTFDDALVVCNSTATEYPYEYNGFYTLDELYNDAVGALSDDYMILANTVSDSD